MKRTDLVNALEMVKPGLSNKEIIEQATCFAFLKGRVITYNDEISISHPVEGLNIEGAINAEAFYKLLGRLKEEDINIEIKEGSEVVIKSGKAKAGIVLQQEIKLPIEEIGKMVNWKKIPDDLIKAMKFCSFSCSKDMSKPKLTCVHVRQDGVIEGCESYRLTRYRLTEENFLSSFLIPASSVQELAKYDFTESCFSPGWVHFKTAQGTIFSCRVFGDTYPNLDEKGVFDVEGIEINLPDKIVNIIENAQIFSKRDHILDEEVEISLTKNKVKIKGQSDVGWYEETVRMRYMGDDVSFLVNPVFLKEVLVLLKNCTLGTNRIKFTGENWEHVLALRSE